MKPGCHLRDLIQHRKETRLLRRRRRYLLRRNSSIPRATRRKDTVISVPDGRMIRLIYKRSPDGGWATTLEDITERRRVEARIEHLAHYDALTNLPNRTLFQRHAEELLVHTSTRRLCDPLYRHRRVQAHQRLARPSDRRRIPAGRRRAPAWNRSARRISWRGSAATNSPSCSTTFTRRTTSTR